MRDRYLTRLLASLVLILHAAVFSACSDDAIVDDFDEEDRGALLEVDRVEKLSESEIRALFQALAIPITVSTSVDLRRVTYRTIDPGGTLTQATALLAVPDRRSGPIPLVSYQHGTVVKRDNVASLRGTDDSEALIAVALATDGYLAVMPDYLGLGLSPGLHPYVHAASLATSVVDALRTARHYARRERIELDGEVFILGYSEGGYATAAAQRLMESAHADEFDLVASAPMAVPWSLSGSMFETFSSTEPYRAPYYLPYTLLAYNDVYEIETDLDNVFASPYDVTIPPLFDGTRSGGEINSSLPPVPRDMLVPSFVEAFLSDEPFSWRQRFEENDLLGWTPQARTRVFHCTSDDLVPFSNAEAAISSFRTLGVPESRVDLVSGAFGTHEECAPVFLLLAKFWIDDVRGVSAGKTRPTVDDLLRVAWRPLAP